MQGKDNWRKGTEDAEVEGRSGGKGTEDADVEGGSGGKGTEDADVEGRSGGKGTEDADVEGRSGREARRPREVMVEDMREEITLYIKGLNENQASRESSDVADLWYPRSPGVFLELTAVKLGLRKSARATPPLVSGVRGAILV